MSGVRYHERLFVAGPTESGKSELLNWFFSGMECQRLLYDTKGHEWTIEGVEAVSDPAAIDWTQPVIHYVTTTTTAAEADEVFTQAEKITTGLFVAVHELGDLCEYTTQRTPQSVNRYLAQGGKWGRGFGGASQEPVDIPKRAKKEIQHAYTMAPPMDLEHLEVVAGIAYGVNAREMAEEINTVHREHGDHAFIHWPRGSLQEPTRYPPLPQWRRDQIIVKPREPHARERSG